MQHPNQLVPFVTRVWEQHARQVSEEAAEECEQRGEAHCPPEPTFQRQRPGTHPDYSHEHDRPVVHCEVSKVVPRIVAVHPKVTGGLLRQRPECEPAVALLRPEEGKEC